MMNINDLCSQINNIMYGMEDVVRLTLVALYTKGHVLLEGNPGLGKTDLVRNISHVLGLPFGRIQFTPDLLPSDITGTQRPVQKNGQLEMDFQPGPLFTSILLADEINRATPKTQAAMLEAMAERQVTVLGETYDLDEYDFRQYDINNNSNLIRTVKPIKGRPFLVMATQNPIDHEGTYDLPEAQSDRFMFKIIMPVPNKADLLKIFKKTTEDIDRDYLLVNQYPEEAVAEYTKHHRKIKALKLQKDVEEHISNIFLATNYKLDEINLQENELKIVRELITLLRFGIGPRGARDLMLATKAYTIFYGPTADQADERSIANVIVPILRHRIKLSYDWKSNFSLPSDIEADRQIDYYIRDLAIHCAPPGREYRRLFQQVINDILDRKAI